MCARVCVCVQDVYRYIGCLIEIEVERPCRIKVSCSVYLSTKSDHDNENRKELHGKLNHSRKLLNDLSELDYHYNTAIGIDSTNKNFK